MANRILVEVAFAEPQRQSLVTVELDPGATVAEAIERSGLVARHTEVDFDSLATGIWGRVVGQEYSLSDGDRVELYRELNIDPREARRQLAEAGRTMRQGNDESPA